MKTLIRIILAIIICSNYVNVVNAGCTNSKSKYKYEWKEAYTKGPNGNIGYNGEYTFCAVGKWKRIEIKTGKKEPIEFFAKYEDNKNNIQWTSKAEPNATRCEKYINRPVFVTKFKKPGMGKLPEKKYNTTIIPIGKQESKKQTYRADKKTTKKNISTPGKQVTIV